MAEMMREPPPAPSVARKRSPDGDAVVTIIGVQDDRGRLFGRMKLAGEGGKSNSLETPGMEKSFISLLLDF